MSNHNNYEVNSMHWDVCPSSLYIILKALYKKYELPIMITENGCADNNYQKTLSIKTMKYFLNGIKLAKEEGVNVIGYHTWTFIDNYEWDDCYVPKFGLYSLSLYQLDKQIKENEKINVTIARVTLVPPQRKSADSRLNEFIELECFRLINLTEVTTYKLC